MTLQLADSSVCFPLGVIEDVSIEVGKFFLPVDFVVMEMKEDKEVPIILGWPFLRTAGELMDVKERTLTLRIGDEKVQFNLNKAMKYPSEPETCCAVDVVDQLAKGQLRDQYSSSFENYPDFLSELQEKKDSQEKACAAKVLTNNQEEPAHGPDSQHTARTPMHTARMQVQPEQAKHELNPLTTNLDPNRTAKLLEDLKTQQIVIEDLIEKLTGANQATCMHRTLPADGHKYTARANQHTGHTQVARSVYFVPWCDEKKRWLYPFEKRVVYPFGILDIGNNEGGLFET
jgi:hypothetical protein